MSNGKGDVEQKILVERTHQAEIKRPGNRRGPLRRRFF